MEVFQERNPEPRRVSVIQDKKYDRKSTSSVSVRRLCMKKDAALYGRYGSPTNTVFRQDDRPRSRVVVATDVHENGMTPVRERHKSEDCEKHGSERIMRPASFAEFAGFAVHHWAPPSLMRSTLLI